MQVRARTTKGPRRKWCTGAHEQRVTTGNAMSACCASSREVLTLMRHYEI